ncbi:hypothetical protein VCV18_012562 [Metarhizium anisopliae]
MPVQLLPASAAAFAPRASSVDVVLGSKVEPWLTQTLKRVNRKRVNRDTGRIKNVPQHQRCLVEILSSPNAIWTLASLMLPKFPEAEMPQEPLQKLFSYQLVHVEAYVVHVDMVLRNEVAYKLTDGTIDALVEYHEKIHSVDAKANTHDWSEKEQQSKKLHEGFVQAVNKFVYRTPVSALEGLEDEGTGELLCGKSEEVKNNLFGLMTPLLPPPPRVVDVVRQPPLLQSSPVNNMWSQPTMHSSVPAVELWRVLPSSPSVTSMSAEFDTAVWATTGMSEVQMSSPTPAYTLPLPSMLVSSQCGVSVGMRHEWHEWHE